MFGVLVMVLIGQKSLMPLPGMNASGFPRWFTGIESGLWPDGLIILIKTGQMYGTQKMAENGKPYISKSIWKERHEPSAFVFQDKIWIAGGMTPPLVNDVWSLKLPKDW